MNAGVATNPIVLRGAIKNYQVERKVGNFIWLDVERGGAGSDRNRCSNKRRTRSRNGNHDSGHRY